MLRLLRHNSEGIFLHCQNSFLEMFRAVFMLLSATLRWEKKSTISFLVFKRSLRLRESQTLSLADGRRSNCENWQCWFWCHFCLLGMQSCPFQRKQQPCFLSGQDLRGAEWWEDFQQPLSLFSSKHMWMWQFSCEHSVSAVLIVHLKGLFQS